MSNVKGRGRGVRRGRGQQKENTTVRGRGGIGARCAIGGRGEDKATTIAERTMLMLMTVMMAIMDQWFLWMWRMPISKHGCQCYVP